MNYYIVIGIGSVCTFVSTLITLWLNEKVKGSVKNSFDKKLEEIKKEHSKELSQFQTELNHLKSKENFKFTKLHEKRFEILQRTYEYLYQNEKYLLAFLSPYYTLEIEVQDDTIEKLKEKFGDKYYINNVEFGQFIDVNLIFFDNDIEELLMDFKAKCNTIFMDNSAVKLKEINEISTEDRLKHFNECFYELKKILTPVRIDVKNKFRELLGE